MYFFILVFVLVIVLVMFVSMMVTKTVQNSGMFEGYPEAQNNINQSESAILNFDNLVLFIIIGLSLFLLITAYYAGSHPIMFVINLISLWISIGFAAFVSNTFWSFRISGGLSATAALFPKTEFLMLHLPTYVLFMGAATIYAAYLGNK